jgi:hypothetical protein
MLHREEFSKSCTANISEVFLQKIMEIIISSSHSRLHYIILDLFYSYMKVESLYGAW